MPTGSRWLLYLVALGLTLAAVVWVGTDDQASSTVTAVSAVQRQTAALDRVSRGAVPAAPAAAIETTRTGLDVLRPREPYRSGANPFATRPWDRTAEELQAAARPRIEVKPVVIEPPRAPPLPYTYLGKWIDEQSITVFLTNQQRNFIARVGDTLEGGYRVAETYEDRIVFEYVPLGARQTLMFAAARPSLPAETSETGVNRPPVRRPRDEDD